MTTLKSELKDCSNKIGDIENTVSGLTTLITSLTTMLEKNGPPPIQHDLLDLSFPPKDIIIDEVLSHEESSSSVQKTALDNTQFQNG